MPATTPQKLAELQGHPENIRNICILAHVDHGKTTLADGLVASNGIISQRMAGKLRYLDSREDEQLRGITMKSSAISLQYTEGEKDYLVNLIDSPGHIDFSSEVSTAVRLCDGAIVVVDAVEGVCPQTHAVLRQAWLEDIKPVLVINKIDRLITELKLTPQEAHQHLQQLLEQINAVTGELFATNIYAKNAEKDTPASPTTPKDSEEKLYDWNVGFDDTDDSQLYFSPDLGNVVFASAIDGWGFSVNQFAAIFAKKLGVKAEIMQKTLWGDFYINNKTKRIMKGAQAKGKKPMFVQFVLENLWAVYDAVCINRDKVKMEKIVSSLNLKVNSRDLSHSDPKVPLLAICKQWLPLSDAVLSMVANQLPSPISISSERIEKLMCSTLRRFDSLPQETQTLKNDFKACSPSDDAPVIVFISKMFPVDRKTLPKNRSRPLTQEELAARKDLAKTRHAERMAKREAAMEKGDEQIKDASAAKNGTAYIPLVNETPVQETGQTFVAFARIFSGTLKKGQKLYVLGPKHDTRKALEELGAGESIDESVTLKDLSRDQHITCISVSDMYMFMGRELEPLQEVPAGNILGIGGLEEHILKSATLSSTVACPAFTEMHFEAKPIVRVAVEPKKPSCLGQLLKGLKLLNQADPCVETLLQETGEHVIIAAGEVHLQRCLDDLRERYAQIEINVSPAIVPFRETIVDPPKLDMVNEAIEKEQNQPKRNVDEQEEADGLVEIKTSDKTCMLKIKALPLPAGVTRLLDEHVDLIKTMDQYTWFSEKCILQKGSRLAEEAIKMVIEFKKKLEAEFEEGGDSWKGAADLIWAFGPRRCGSNILLNRIQGYKRPSVWACVEEISSVPLREYDSSVLSGFQLVTLSGPLCEEPLMGVCFALEGWQVEAETVSEISEPGDEDMSSALSKVTLDEVCQCETDSDQLAIPEENICTMCSRPIKSHSPSTKKTNEDDKMSQVSSTGTSMSRKHSYGPFTGQLMTAVKNGCRKAFQVQPQRLMAAMYTCQIQASADTLGKLYAVLGKRGGRILSEDLQEGSQMFNIEAVLPVVESFGFAEEIRKRTSGLASPQLKFSHWEVVDIDPYWDPRTEEELLHFGAKADSENQARKYMNDVRRRKGLKVKEQLVLHAEKQRTLKKNV